MSPARVRRDSNVPDDVLDDDDRVVDEDADREDQREEGHPIERVPEEVKDQQRERERHGNGDRDDARRAPAEREPDERRDREHREQHVEEQLVRLLFRRLAVVASHVDSDVGGNEMASSARTFASTRSATPVAFVALRFATEIVTAGRVPATDLDPNMT